MRICQSCCWELSVCQIKNLFGPCEAWKKSSISWCTCSTYNISLSVPWPFNVKRAVILRYFVAISTEMHPTHTNFKFSRLCLTVSKVLQYCRPNCKICSCKTQSYLGGWWSSYSTHKFHRWSDDNFIASDDVFEKRRLLKNHSTSHNTFHVRHSRIQTNLVLWGYIFKCDIVRIFIHRRSSFKSIFNLVDESLFKTWYLVLLACMENMECIYYYKG